MLAALLATGGSDAAPAPGAGPDAAPAAPERSPVPAAVSLELAGSLAERRELSEAPSSNGYDASRGTLLHGRVVDQNGAPIAGARISVRRPGARRGQDAAYAEGRGYAVPGLDPGNWWLTCTAEGYRSFEAALELRALAQQQFDFALSRARVLHVALVDESGTAVSRSLGKVQPQLLWRIGVVATTDPPPDAFPMTTYGSSLGLGVGTWQPRKDADELPERFAGRLEIATEGPVWVAAVLRQHVLAKVLVPPGQVELDLVIPQERVRATLATVRARVVAAGSGAALTGAEFLVSDRQGGGRGSPANAEGVVVFEHAIPGIVEVSVRAHGRELYQRMVRLRAGQDLDLGTLRIDRPRRLAGRVRGPDGEELAGVILRCFRIDRTADDVPLDNGFSTRSVAKGAFTLSSVGAGRYLVQASHDRGVAQTVVDTGSGDVDDFELRLHAGVDVIVENRVPPTRTYLVNLTDEQGLRVHGWLERPIPTLRERPVRLVPGRYQVEIRDDEGVVRSTVLDARGPGARLLVP